MQSDRRARDQEAMEALVRGMAEALGLTVWPEWVPGVAQQFAITLAMVDVLDTIVIADDAQAAPVYRL